MTLRFEDAASRRSLEGATLARFTGTGGGFPAGPNPRPPVLPHDDPLSPAGPNPRPPPVLPHDVPVLPHDAPVLSHDDPLSPSPEVGSFPEESTATPSVRI